MQNDKIKKVVFSVCAQQQFLQHEDRPRAQTKMSQKVIIKQAAVQKSKISVGFSSRLNISLLLRSTTSPFNSSIFIFYASSESSLVSVLLYLLNKKQKSFSLQIMEIMILHFSKTQNICKNSPRTLKIMTNSINSVNDHLVQICNCI